jgi:hypothetical protein
MPKLIQNQFNMKDNLKMIEDSLSAIARRQVMVKPFIIKEITKINQAQEQIMVLLKETQEPSLQYYNRNRNAQIASKQQFVMTALNDLALMLAESLKNMKDKQSGSNEGGSCKNGKCGKKDCSKCGNGGGDSSGSKSKPSKSMREMQERLNKQLEEARKQMEKGEKEGGEKSGNKPNGQQNGQQSMSEQFARMAAQQEAIRKMLQNQQSEMKKEGKGYGDVDKMLKDMEEIEKDLVNKRITQQTINRMQQIETRLLESERAEMQREKEEKRESREARQLPNSTIPPFIEQQLNKKKEIELYKTIPPTLSNFYKDKVNAYFYRFDGE